jgi:hypothetical protein
MDSHSAFEILEARLKAASEQAAQEKARQEAEGKSDTSRPAKRVPKEESIFDNPAVKQATRTAANVITRSLLGALGLGGKSRRKSLF